MEATVNHPSPLEDPSLSAKEPSQPHDNVQTPLTTHQTQEEGTPSTGTIPICPVMSTNSRKQPVQELTPEDCAQIFESSAVSPRKLVRLLEESIVNSYGTDLINMISTIQSADLSQKTIGWVLEQVASFYNGRCEPSDGVMRDNQKYQKRTILMGYILMTVFQIQQNQLTGNESQAELFLLKLDSKSILQESVKIASQLQRMIREQQSLSEDGKDKQRPLFNKIVAKLFESRQQERISIVADMETKQGNQRLKSMLTDLKSGKTTEIEEATTLSQNHHSEQSGYIELDLKSWSSPKNMTKIDEDPKDDKQSDATSKENVRNTESEVAICANDESDPEEPNNHDNGVDFAREPERQSICSTADTSNITLGDIQQNEIQNRLLDPVVTLPEHEEEQIEFTPHFPINVLPPPDPQQSEPTDKQNCPTVIGADDPLEIVEILDEQVPQPRVRQVVEEQIVGGVIISDL